MNSNLATMRPDIQARAIQLTSNPVHIRRDIEEPGQSIAALQIVHSSIIPYLYEVKHLLNIPWLDHVCEAGRDMTWEHLVLPEVIWLEHGAILRQAGFSEQSDQRQFACAEGLKEALLSGSDMNKKWS